MSLVRRNLEVTQYTFKEKKNDKGIKNHLGQGFHGGMWTFSS